MSSSTEIESYFDRFVEAFATFKGERVADLIAVPFIALSDNGSLRAFIDRTEIVSYYQAALDAYHDDGCRFCEWSDLTITATGSAAVVAAVTWNLLRADGTVATRWRQSYGLSLVQIHKPTAFSAVSHRER